MPNMIVVIENISMRKKKMAERAAVLKKPMANMTMTTVMLKMVNGTR